MLSQKLCGPLFLYKWNLYDHLTDVSIDYSGSHIRDNFISSNWRPLLAFFISVRNKIGIQSLVSCSLHYHGISCLFCKHVLPNKNDTTPSYKSPCITLSTEEIMCTPWPSSGNVRWVNISLPLQDFMGNILWQMLGDGELASICKAPQAKTWCL